MEAIFDGDVGADEIKRVAVEIHELELFEELAFRALTEPLSPSDQKRLSSGRMIRESLLRLGVDLEAT